MNAGRDKGLIIVTVEWCRVERVFVETTSRGHETNPAVIILIVLKNETTKRQVEQRENGAGFMISGELYQLSKCICIYMSYMDMI
jgi:hypothetical protein